MPKKQTMTFGQVGVEELLLIVGSSGTISTTTGTTAIAAAITILYAGLRLRPLSKSTVYNCLSEELTKVLGVSLQQHAETTDGKLTAPPGS